MAVFFLLTDAIRATNSLGSITPQGSTSADRQTYMNTVNAAGGVDAWALPNSSRDAYYLARSPILAKHFKVKYVTDSNPAPAGAKTWGWPLRPSPYFTPFTVYLDESVTSDATLNIYKAENDATPFVSLKASHIKGVADFDVSTIAQTLLSDKLSDMSNYESIDEPALSGTMFLVASDNTNGWQIQFVNGIDDEWRDNSGREFVSGELILLSQNHDFVVWNKGDSNTWYERYPEVSIYNPNYEDESIGSAGQGMSITIPAFTVKRIKVRTQVFVDILTDYFDDITFTFRIVNLYKCAPFMVRWINTNGGVDTYVFTRHQSIEHDIKTTQRYTLRPDVGVYLNSARAYDVTALRDILCGKDMISDGEYKLLLELAKSQHIDCYDDEKAGTYGSSWPYTVVYPIWIPATVKEFKGKQNTESETQSYEIRLRLPDIKVF